jgi:signal transduction histidine kinase
MRQLVMDLRPPALDGGLAPALQWLAAEYQRMSGVTCEAAVDPQVRALNPEVKTMVFRVAQESLNNIARHARATHVHLQLQCNDKGWDLRIDDDGVGFETDRPSRGFGLLSMEERAQLMGGTLRIESQPGQGTHVHLHVPISAATVDAA